MHPPFSKLSRAGIVTPEHLELAQGHVALYELGPKPSLADEVQWFVKHGILAYAELEGVQHHVATRFAGEERARYEEAIRAGLAMFDQFRARNLAALDTLVGEGLITLVERNRAVERMVRGREHASDPAGWLILMTLQEVITMARLNEIRALASKGGSSERAAILAEVDKIDRLLSAPAAAKRKEWTWPLAAGVAAVFGAWFLFGSKAPPDCDDGDVLAAINHGFFVDHVFELGRLGENAPKPPQSKLHSASEIGYASKERIRACKATLKSGDTERPYAFTIESVGENGEYHALTAHPELAQARFSHIDGEGRFADLAQPLGRKAVEGAFRAGVKRFRDEIRARRPVTTKPAWDAEQKEPPEAGRKHRAWKRSREIVEVEPMGACREIAAGKLYSCRLLVERNDAFMNAFGAQRSRVVAADFTFERGADGGWQTTKAFKEEYVKATAASRSEPAGS